MHSRLTANICIEASPATQNQAGLGRYTLNLIKNLSLCDSEFNYSLSYNDRTNAIIPTELTQIKHYSSGLTNNWWRLLNALTYTNKNLLSSYYKGVDIFHSTGHLLPKLDNVRTVFTLHDLIPLLYPSYHKPLNRIFLSVMMPLFLQTADAIISVSNNTKDDAIKYTNTDPSKIVVIPEAVSPSFHNITDEQHLTYVRNKYKLPERFVLCVSTIEPRKNHTTLLSAFERLHKDHPNLVLALAGRLGWLYEPILTQIENSSARHNVRLLGQVPDKDLPALLSAATIFAFPSVYEGFGLPPLEAMACSTPVVCSNTSSIPEVVGEAALMCDPFVVESWHTQLNKLLLDKSLQEKHSQIGLTHSKKFSWSSVAMATSQLYKTLLR